MTLKTRSRLLAATALLTTVTAVSACSSSTSTATATATSVPGPATSATVADSASGTPATPSITPSAPTAQLSEKQQSDVRKNLIPEFKAYEVVVSTARLGETGPAAQMPTDYTADQQAAAKFWGHGGLAAPLACGTAHGNDGIDGVLLDPPTAGPKGVTSTVHLYIGAEQVATAAVVSDPVTGKLKDFTCGPATDSPALGAPAIAGYYGGFTAATRSGGDAAVAKALAAYISPPFQHFSWLGLDAESTTCSQDVIQFWNAASTPSASDPNLWTLDHMTAAVDDAGKHIAWVNCSGGLPEQPKPTVRVKEDQIAEYVGGLWYAYGYLQALKPFGVDPAAVKPYFTSDATYSAAWKTTGTIPLECSPTLAGSFNPDKVTIAGETAVIAMTALPSWHMLSEGEKALGHPKVTLDLATMKVAAVSCS